MLLLLLTSYLFVQGPRLWVWRNLFCSLRLFPVFDPFASFDRPRFSRFPKKVMKKVITHNFNTVNVLSSFFRCSRLSLTTSCHFQTPHVIMLSIVNYVLRY